MACEPLPTTRPRGAELLDKLRISKVLVELADTLVDDFDVVDFSQRLCQHASGLLDMGAAGVMLVDQSATLQVLAASSDEVEILEVFELGREQGPGVQAHATGQFVWADNPDEMIERWPRLGVLVAAHYKSVYAFPLRLRGQMLGALTLYGIKPAALNPADIPLGQALADIATISLLQTQELDQANQLSQQLQNALNSRVVIEQAKGKYAERHATTLQVAFNALRSHSQRHNMKLIEVASGFVSGELLVDPLENG